MSELAAHGAWKTAFNPRKAMNEIIAKIGPEHSIELVEFRSGKVGSRLHMTPDDGAYLARAILACAASLHSATPPQVGEIVTDSHLPVSSWKILPSANELLLTLTISSGIELTFQMPPHLFSQSGMDHRH
jgi:hypothetical protein